jgi:hypothetical protein
LDESGGAEGVWAIALAASAPMPSPPVSNTTIGSGDFIGATPLLEAVSAEESA